MLSLERCAGVGGGGGASRRSGEEGWQLVTSQGVVRWGEGYLPGCLF